MKSERKNIIEFQKKSNCTLVLDGAVGSLLQQRKIKPDKTLWSSYANITNPEEVIEVHKEYIKAGADIITTNTFRTNPIAYNSSFLNISNYEFVKQSVKLAMKAVNMSSNIFIAGSNPPGEDSYQTSRKISKKKIETNHKEHIDMLWESGVDFVLNETQSHIDEIEIICKHCSANNIPYIISLFVTADGNILSGEQLYEVLNFVNDYNPIAVSINCIAPNVFAKVLSVIDYYQRWGFYINCGSGNYTDSKIFEGVNPSDYINIIKRKYKEEPFFIGSCCGSSPLHTKAIKEYLDRKY